MLGTNPIITLDEAQTRALIHLARQPNVIIWHKIGEGKSRIAIYWTYFMTQGDPRPLIICSPEAFRTWEDEIELLALGRPYKPFFFSYGMLAKSKKGVWELNRQMKSKGWEPNCAIIDELWLYKNPSSQRSMAVQAVASAWPTIGLSGSM